MKHIPLVLLAVMLFACTEKTPVDALPDETPSIEVPPAEPQPEDSTQTEQPPVQEPEPEPEPDNVIPVLAVGDFYDGGLVFEVEEDYAKLVSIREGLCFWAQESVKNVRVGTEASPEEGETNTIMFKERADMEKFDAVIWCINYGDEWYMPSRAEIAAIVNGLGLTDTDRQTAINAALVENGGTGFTFGDAYFWTCCEHATDDSKAWCVRLRDKGHGAYSKKGSSPRPVRAVRKVYFGSSAPQQKPIEPPVVEGTDYDVFLLIGQSNMAGRGIMTAADQQVFDPNVFLLNASGDVEGARNPLNQYSTIKKDVEQGINPGFSFSKKIAAETGRKVLLVVNARGGTALYEWKKSSSKGYYNEAVSRTRQAQKYGKLVGILWHQGESNSSSPSGYLESLKVMVDDMRKDLNAPDVPFIAGEIAQWQSNASKFNPVIQGISSVISNSDYVSSEGCSPLKDESDPHFSRDGQILLGERYAEKILQYCYEK